MSSIEEAVTIERVNYRHFRVLHDGQWVDIKKGDIGFYEISHYFPVFKAAHCKKARSAEKPTA